MRQPFLLDFKRVAALPLVFLMCLLLAASCSDGPESTGQEGERGHDRTEMFKLQPFGDIPEAQVNLVVEAVEAYFDCKVTVVPAIKLPESAWYAPRKRYRADSLLRYLHRNLEPEYDRAFGLTTKDISTTKKPHEDWGIMGLGSYPGKVCVVSTFRIKRGVNQKQFETRLKRVALHELGHTMGLLHCDNKSCLMRDANGKVTTVDEEGDQMCKRCHYVVAKHLRKG